MIKFEHNQTPLTCPCNSQIWNPQSPHHKHEIFPKGTKFHHPIELQNNPTKASRFKHGCHLLLLGDLLPELRRLLPNRIHPTKEDAASSMEMEKIKICAWLELRRYPPPRRRRRRRRGRPGFGGGGGGDLWSTFVLFNLVWNVFVYGRLRFGELGSEMILAVDRNN